MLLANLKHLPGQQRVKDVWIPAHGEDVDGLLNVVLPTLNNFTRAVSHTLGLLRVEAEDHHQTLIHPLRHEKLSHTTRQKMRRHAFETIEHTHTHIDTYTHRHIHTHIDTNTHRDTDKHTHIHTHNEEHSHSISTEAEREHQGLPPRY